MTFLYQHKFLTENSFCLFSAIWVKLKFLFYIHVYMCTYVF